MYYPHPLRMQPNDKPMTVIDRYFAYYKRSGKKYVRYLYDGLLEAMVKEMHENVENDFDNVICIWGREGSGKSVLGYWVLKTFDPDFDMEQCYVPSYDELLKKIYESDAKEGAVFWLDEATNIASNRDWMNADNKQFIKILEIFRSRKWTLILCIPDINRLDKYLREQRIRYTLHAQILDWEGNSHKERGYAELKRIDVQANNYRCEQTVGFLKFPDIPAADKEKYRRIKQDTQDDILREMYEKKNKQGRDTAGAKALRKLILEKKESGMSVREIAEETGLNEQTVMNYCSKARRERGDKDEDRTFHVHVFLHSDYAHHRWNLYVAGPYGADR